MELSVAVEDFERFISENKQGWKRIELALDKITDDNGKNIDVTFQFKRLSHLLKSISKFDDFQFHWEALKASFKSGKSVKQVSTATQTDAELTNNNLQELSDKLALCLQRGNIGTSESSSNDTQGSTGNAEDETESPRPVDPIHFEQFTKITNGQDVSLNLFDEPKREYLEGACSDRELDSFSSLKSPTQNNLISKSNLDEFLGQYCIQCSARFENQFNLVDHLKENDSCKQLIRNIGLNYCFVCKKAYESVKKAKTHYTNYRNQGVNPHDVSRTLHRQWFDIIQFPTSRELESIDTTQRDITVSQSAKCHGCQEQFIGHDECLEHIYSNVKCQVHVKLLGKTYCFVCDRSYEKEKQAETHYRNSMYNGHQLHRCHHRRYFDFIRDRKSPGRPPRNSEMKFKLLELNLSCINTQSSDEEEFVQVMGLQESFDCMICEEKFTNEVSRFNHLSNENHPCHHQLPEFFKTICLICQKNMETEQKLSSHLRLHKNEWHKKYYEMFYRKRPGKRSLMAIDDPILNGTCKRLTPAPRTLLPENVL